VAQKLFVGSLDYSVTDQQLHDLFSPYGEIESATVIVDRETKRSRGFGFVEFTNEDEANAAMEALHGTEHMGRSLVVNEARQKK
jgi:RNA recognition motif-containing protein